MTWLARTGQRWKLIAGVIGMLPSGACFVQGIRLTNACAGPAGTYCRSDDQSMAYMLAGTAIGVASFLWLCLAPRCPKCGRRVAWWAVSTLPSGAWVTGLLQLQSCPRCGDDCAIAE